MGRPDFFPKSAPSTGKLRFSVFSPRPGFICVPKAVLGQNGLKYLYFAISRPWGSGQPKRDMEKLRTTIPDSVVTFFSVSGPLAPGNRVFLFLAQSRNFSKCLRPKTGQNTTKSPFPTGEGPTEKKSFPRKLRKTIPDSVVTFFLILGPLLLWGPERALRAICCLLAASLLARRASSTLVP